MTCFYTKFECAVLLNNRETDWFIVNSGVRQGCIMSPILFLISIDWVMKKMTDSKRGITWSIYTTLEDLDFADDIALLSSRHSDMKNKDWKTQPLCNQLGLLLNASKTEEMRFNVTYAPRWMLTHSKSLRWPKNIFMHTYSKIVNNKKRIYQIAHLRNHFKSINTFMQTRTLIRSWKTHFLLLDIWIIFSCKTLSTHHQKMLCAKFIKKLVWWFYRWIF